MYIATRGIVFVLVEGSLLTEEFPLPLSWHRFRSRRECSVLTLCTRNHGSNLELIELGKFQRDVVYSRIALDQ